MGVVVTSSRVAVGGGGSPGGYSPQPAPTLLRWCGRRRSLALAGRAPVVRLWDAHSELLLADIPTGDYTHAPQLFLPVLWLVSHGHVTTDRSLKVIHFTFFR